MRLYRFDPLVGKPVTRYGSVNLVIAKLLPIPGEAELRCIYLGPAGELGYHVAVTGQLFFVIQGSGWVAGGDGKRVPISSGQAASWLQGEGHAAGTDTGLTALILEALHLAPETWMPSVEEPRIDSGGEA